LGGVPGHPHLADRLPDRGSLCALGLALAALLAATTPATAITGGTEDLANKYSNVGMVVFYQPDGRFRCSGTLISPQVFLTAAHCTFEDIGKVVVTFDPLISRSEEEAEIDIPRAADDSGPDDAISTIGFTTADITPPDYEGEQTWFLGTPRTYPNYSDFTDLRNWNDTGVVLLDQAPGLGSASLAPENYLNRFRQPLLNATEFLVLGYGTEVRGHPADTGARADRASIHHRDRSEVDRADPADQRQRNGSPCGWWYLLR